MKVARHFLPFLFWLVACYPLFAQQAIKGKVIYDKTQESVVSAAVMVYPVGSEDILVYTMTTADGTFTIKSEQLPDTVVISVRAMTIESLSETVSRHTSFLELRAKEKQTELKEVVVKAPKIRQAGDTINYSVASFIDPTDRSIADILKKLPGVQLLSSGQILYQNKEITKFYVEGMDLLQGKYGIATNNIEAADVTTVQILENHQPVKVLKDIEIPEEAAINLKLKRSALGAFFATAQLGTGLPALLYSNEAVGMRFTRTQQNMLLYKDDNTGRDVTRELISFYGDPLSKESSFFQVQSPAAPHIREQHYLFNDAHMGSLNDLRVLKKDLILTSNVNFLYDRQTAGSYARQEIFLEDGGSIRIAENMQSRLLKRELDGTITLEDNRDDFYLTNKLNVLAKWNSLQSDVVTDQSVNQYLQQPSFNIGNVFTYISRKGKTNRRFDGNVSFVSQNHALRVSPVLFDALSELDSVVRQDVSFLQFKSDFRYFYSWSVGRFDLNYQTGMFFNHYILKSDLFTGTKSLPVVVDSLRNDLRRTEAGGYLTSQLSYGFSSGTRINVEMPLRLLYLDRVDLPRGTDRKKGYLLYKPTAKVEFNLNKRTIMNVSVSYNNHIGSVSEDYRGYLMTSYRSMHRSDGILSKTRNTNVLAYINFRNPFTTLFATMNIFYSNNWRNVLYDIRYNGILNNEVGIEHPNRSHSYGTEFTLGKSVEAIDSEVKITTGYNSNSSLALNQGQIAHFDLYSFYASPNVVTNINNSLVVKYDASFRYTRNKIGDNKTKPISNLDQSINTSFIPVKKLVFNVGFNHYYNIRVESDARSSCFANVGVQYKLKQVDLILDWTNIFNTKQFVTYSYNDVSSFYSVYDLRPMEILFRVRFKIF